MIFRNGREYARARTDVQTTNSTDSNSSKTSKCHGQSSTRHFEVQDQAGSIEMQTTFLGKEFSAFQGEVPISKVVQDHRYCEEAGVTADYYSDSTTQEFSLLRIKIFSPSSTPMHAFPTCCLPWISQWHPRTEFAANQGPFLAQFCPIPVSWACAKILNIFAVPGNASVVLVAPPLREQESVFKQLLPRTQGSICH